MTPTSVLPVLRAAGDFARDLATGWGAGAITENGGHPLRFGIFRKEGVTLFVDGGHGPVAEMPAGRWPSFRGADAQVGAIRASGALCEGPRQVACDKRDLNLRDPDGNLLHFGMETA